MSVIKSVVMINKREFPGIFFTTRANVSMACLGSKMSTRMFFLPSKTGFFGSLMKKIT